MLSRLPRTSVSFKFETNLPLLMLKGIGWESNTSHQYVWQGSKRQDEHFLFQYTVSGQGELEVKGRTYQLKAGDAFIIEIPSDHCYRLPPYSDNWEVLFLEFSKEASPYWRQLLNNTGYVVSILPDSFLLQLAWKIYEWSVREEESHSMYQCSSYAYQFVMELLSYSQKIQMSKQLPSKIELCKQFIDAHYAEPIGLKEMAEAAGLSKFHLTREFDKKLGISPTDYLTEVRIEKSEKLLSSTDDNLESIAKKVGFSCANYFSKVFKKRIGITPNQFRKNRYEISRILYN
ncbi:helix-turn-helix domain-containing protein [Paenibacillus sp. Soil724D2]|uniref:helix-turn-helix domain-containing protein n=1 Tax=Paenibacillus sp. (strain Soil724D2) TaxID=1736392 RepID=UPI0007137DBE|nr:helix-turn-helix domain-containing protein [Paenibacillus sp. Soil724D2]KRE48422.1 hypothetical protein ASG85_05310 [Paenibacillus sp. Soil724D2]